MGRALIQPGGVDVEQRLEGGVVEGQPLGRAEDGHGVGQMVQRLVMGLDMATQGVARLFGLGHVEGEGQNGPGPALDRLGDNPPGAAPSATGRPAEAVLMPVGPAGLGDNGVGATVEAQSLFARLFDAVGLHLGQPGLVGPGQPTGCVGDPGRRRIGIRQQAQTALGGRADQPEPRQPQPGRACRGPALDRPGPAGPFQHGVKGLTLVDQGIQPRSRRPPRGVQHDQAGVTGVVFVAAEFTGQGCPGLGRSQPPGLSIGRQGQPHILKGRQCPVAIGQINQSRRQGRLRHLIARSQPPTQPRGPGAEGQGQPRGTRGRDIGDVGLGHGVVSAPAT